MYHGLKYDGVYLHIKVRQACHWGVDGRLEKCKIDVDGCEGRSVVLRITKESTISERFCDNN